MNPLRRRFVLFAVALVVGVSAFATEDAKRLPNIIFILADDVSADELAPYGGSIRMPNLQKLADDGVLFRNAWSTPVCAPSRAMMMTGKYPHHTGYYENPVCPEVPFWEDSRSRSAELAGDRRNAHGPSAQGAIHQARPLWPR